MMAFASRTGTKRNLALLREAEWGLLVSVTGVWRTEGFDVWAAENGQWTERDNPAPFKAERYERFLVWAAAQPIRPQWLTLPDIVFGGLPSLHLSRRWPRLLRRRKAWRDQAFMLVVQDGMEVRHVRRLVGPKVGIFVGGSTEWKLETMPTWAALARSRDALCHCGRVNSQRRIAMCADAGVDSFDGTSATMYACNIRKLDLARRQTSLVGLIARATSVLEAA